MGNQLEIPRKKQYLVLVHDPMHGAIFYFLIIDRWSSLTCSSRLQHEYLLVLLAEAFLGEFIRIGMRRLIIDILWWLAEHSENKGNITSTGQETLGLCGRVNVGVVVFQSVFRAEMHQNNVFLFLKNYFWDQRI